MKCPYCGEAVADQAEACVRCGSRITWGEDGVNVAEPEHWVPVFTARDATSLPVIESLLESNGIPFSVVNELAQDFLAWGRAGVGYNPVIGPPVVRVPSEREQEARELIEASASAPLPEDPLEE